MSKNKDEEIKLYLNAITKRDPSKRQIKPVDKDAFQLFDDIESGSDEDFVVGSDDFSDDQQIEESEEENEDENIDAENESEESSSTNVSGKLDRKAKKEEIKQENNNILYDNFSDSRAIVNKTKLENVLICMMCLLDTSFSDNELVECDGCGIVVHEDCYKISDSVFMPDDDNASDSSTDPWFCDACLTHVDNPRCELCPAEGGVFKRTENNRWVHLLCALYTPGVAFNDIENLSEITLSELPLKDWSARECGLCTNPFLARTGICISCDAGLCKNVFHVLCAQKEGLLSEPNNEENSDDPYFANCRQHTDKETVKRRRKNWNAAVNRQKLRIEEWQTNNHFNDARLIRKREFFSSMHSKFLELVPTPFVPKTKVACYLETNPIAVFLFKKKATNLRLPQDVLNSQTSNDTKNVASGIPVFGPDFITYFLDREKKIDETSQEIVRLESFRRELQISEQNTSHQFNKTVGKKKLAEKEFQSILEQVTMKCDIIKQLIKHRELTDVISNLLAKFQIPINGSNGNGSESLLSGADKDSNANNNSSNKPKPDSVINECYMCKRVSDQHMLIDCDNCHKFIHIGCLDPPLTRMPRKTKLYGWQCSLCSCVTSDDEHGKNVDINRPRQLRRSNDLRSKYSRHEEKFSSAEKFSRKILKRTKQRSIINRTRSKPEAPSAVKKETPPNLEEVFIEPPATSNSPINSTNETPDCSNVPESEPATDNSTASKPPQLIAQRKSDRSRKRPLTLLDEYETTVKRKRPNLQKVIKSMQIRKTTSPMKDNMKNRLARLTKISKSFSSQSNGETVEPMKAHKQPITFYPSSEPVSVSSKQSSKQSSESEHVQIGVVAKKLPVPLSRECNYGTQKGFEKKSILIKCHNEHDDDDRLTATETLARFSGTSGTSKQGNLADYFM